MGLKRMKCYHQMRNQKYHFESQHSYLGTILQLFEIRIYTFRAHKVCGGCTTHYFDGFGGKLKFLSFRVPDIFFFFFLNTTIFQFSDYFYMHSILHGAMFGDTI